MKAQSYKFTFLAGLLLTTACAGRDSGSPVSDRGFDSASYWNGQSHAPTGYRVPALCRHVDQQTGIATYFGILWPADRAPENMPASSINVSAGATSYKNATVVVTKYDTKTNKVLLREQLTATYGTFSSNDTRTNEAHNSLGAMATEESLNTTSSYFGPLKWRDDLFSFENNGEGWTNFTNATAVDRPNFEKGAAVDCKVSEK